MKSSFCDERQVVFDLRKNQLNACGAAFDPVQHRSSRRRGWRRKLPAKAIELNQTNGLTLMVDVDNDPAIQLYLSAGFVDEPDGANQTASWMIP